MSHFTNMKTRFQNLFYLENFPDSILESTPTLIDDKPLLELMNEESIKEWRKTWFVP